jgi:hypothetical protein
MQKRTWSGTIMAAVLAASGVVMAQSPASQPTTQTPSASTPSATQAASAPAASANSVTVTGCLREASPAAAATSGSSTPGATDAKANATTDAKFVLADASPSPAATSAAGAAPSAPQTYRLLANDAALVPHVGKKLEFTGTVEGKDSNSGESKLRVESARVIASDCK